MLVWQNQCGLYCIEISIHSWSIFFIRLIITADLNVRHRKGRCNGKEIRDEIRYLDALQIRESLLIGRMRSTVSVRCYSEALYSEIHYLRGWYRRLNGIATRKSILQNRQTLPEGVTDFHTTWKVLAHL